MSSDFARLGLPDPIVRALARRGIDEPFPVQRAAIPDVLAGRDVSGMAPTGSGKTLAFGLPVLTRVGKAKRHRPRALMLAPTRELAEQITQELRPAAGAVDRSVFALYGGVGYGPQRKALRNGVDVLVATPGRLEDLIDQGLVDLSDVDIAVVDEADRMADMGFLPVVRRILDQTSTPRQTLLFSATLDGDIAVLSRDYQRDPVRHEADAVGSDEVDARHHFWLVDHHDRPQHTADLVRHAGRSIVFTRTRHGADRLSKQLGRLGVDAVSIHGGRSQNQRNRALQTFSSGRASALVATDVAARGIHVDSVASVIHYDPPADSKDYLHRSGRTARAGATGSVVSLVTGAQKSSVRRMQRDLDLQGPIAEPRIDDLEGGGNPMGDSPAPNGRARNAGDRTEPKNGHPSPAERTRPDRESGTPSIYVSNLPWAVTEQDLHDLFARFGEVHQTKVVSDRRTGRSRGFGFVDMPRNSAEAAIDELHGEEMGGRDLTVKFARPRRTRS